MPPLLPERREPSILRIQDSITKSGPGYNLVSYSGGPVRVHLLLSRGRGNITVTNEFLERQVAVLAALAHLHAPLLDVARESHGLLLPLLPGHRTRNVIRVYHCIERRLGRGGHGTVLHLVSNNYTKIIAYFSSNDSLWSEASEAVADKHDLAAHKLIIRAYDIRDTLNERFFGRTYNFGELPRQSLSG